LSISQDWLEAVNQARLRDHKLRMFDNSTRPA